MINHKRRGLFVLIALVGVACGGRSSDVKSMETVGTAFEVRVKYSTRYDNGNSQGHTALLERIIENNDKGLVVDYDFTEKTSEEQKAAEWRYPVRLLIKPDKSVELLNSKELKARNKRWLEDAGLDDSACGHWYFTWNAFKVECDPQTAIDGLESFNLHALKMQNGETLSEPGTLHPRRLNVVQSNPLVLTATYEIDPNAVRMARAEQELIVAQIMGQEAPEIGDALTKQESWNISGELTTTLYFDEQGRIVKRVRDTSVSMESENGETESMRSKETTTRRLLSNDE